jgi:hypothetical protein
MNLRIEDTKNQIINVINNSGLPIGVIYYLFKDINIEVTNEYNRTLNAERQMQLQNEEKQQEENNDDVKESE